MNSRSIILALVYFSQLWRIAKWANRGKVKILMYHGVTDQPVMNWTQIGVADFERQMRYISSTYHPVSLQDAMEILAGERPSVANAVVVTFDDGFKNNVTIAYPILQHYRIPATVFVTTSFIDRSSRYAGLIWTDYMYAILDASECQELDLRDLGLGYYDLSTSELRSDAKAAICQQLKQCDYAEKDRLIGLIRSRVGGLVRQETREVLAAMSWDDMVRLEQERLVSFGAHTVNHEILSRVPEPVMVEEIIGAQDTLQQRLGRPIRHFAYPNGTAEDFTEQATKIVQQNYTCGLTTIAGQNPPGSDPYRLRRLSIGRDTTFTYFKLSLAGITDVIYSLKRALVPSKPND